MSTTYDPGADSSPRWTSKAAETGRVVLDISDSACLCGCREPTPGRFRPGHDARLKGKLLRAHLAKVGVLIIKDGKEHSKTARAYAKDVSSDKFDWTVALDKAADRVKEAQAALRDKVADSLARVTSEGEVEQKVEEAVSDAG